MSGLLALFKRLAVFALLSACLDFLMPDGKTKGYLRLAGGLILLEAAVEPVSRFFTEVFG